MRTFEYTDEKSNKFWNIDFQGTSFTVTYGRIGTKGQTQTKEFDTEEKTRKAHDKLVDEKLGKGYVETTVVTKAAPSTVLTGLEKALVNDPNDIASHSAYADYLMEQNDPRGELIQTQLRLEEPDLKDKEREELQKKADALIHQYARHWLGDVGRFLVGKWSGPDKPYHFEIVRGWLDMVRALPCPEAIFASLSTAPEARLLRHLEIVYDMEYHPWEWEEFVEQVNNVLHEGEEEVDLDEGMWQNQVMPPLLEGPGLTNLRSFKLGFSDKDQKGLCHSTMVGPFATCNAQQILELLKKSPGIEELYLNADLPGIAELFASSRLKNVRVLQYYFGSAYSHYPDRSDPYPLSALAGNRNLKKLQSLRLHPGRDSTINLDGLNAILGSKNFPALTHLQVHMLTVGNEGYQAIVDSGILKRLKTLDLGYGNMSDEARILAECPELKNLETLNVFRNGLTATGIEALSKTGINVIAEGQHDFDDMDFLYEVDIE